MRPAPVIVLTDPHAGAWRLHSLLARQPDLACTSGTGILPLCEQAVATWRNVDGRAARPLPTLAAASIRALPASLSPGSLVVITSRNRLTGLAAAQGAHVLTLDPLTAPEARELLAQRLGPQRMTSEATAVADLIRVCAGLPLAIAAAAARITSSPGLPVASVTRELTEAGPPLDALDTGDPATSVRSAFSWSCQKLSAPAAHLFGQIGIHDGQDIALDDAARLARIPTDYARRLLAELTRAHLASEHPPPGSVSTP
jgi:hypothetical protein